MNPLHPVNVLLVEDDLADAMLIREVLEKDRVLLALTHVEDGVEGLRLLRREPPYTDAATPDLILLDLNMPRMSGQEMLAELKADPALADIPVVILTTSSSHNDITQSYHNQASCFVTKPVDLAAFRHIINQISGFWLTVVRYPPGRSGL